MINLCGGRRKHGGGVAKQLTTTYRLKKCQIVVPQDLKSLFFMKTHGTKVVIYEICNIALRGC